MTRNGNTISTTVSRMNFLFPFTIFDWKSNQPLICKAKIFLATNDNMIQHLYFQ